MADKLEVWLLKHVFDTAYIHILLHTVKTKQQEKVENVAHTITNVILKNKLLVLVFPNVWRLQWVILTFKKWICSEYFSWLMRTVTDLLCSCSQLNYSSNVRGQIEMSLFSI